MTKPSARSALSCTLNSSSLITPLAISSLAEPQTVIFVTFAEASNGGSRCSQTLMVFDFYYESHGTGQPVVLVHGLGLSGDMWHYQVPALAERYRVITIDNRGFGQTSKPKGPYVFMYYVEDLLQLIDFLGFEKPVLIGLSMGGGSATS